MLQVNFLPWRMVKQRKQMKRFISLVLCYQVCTAGVLWGFYQSIQNQQSLLARSLSEAEMSNRQMVHSMALIKQYQEELAKFDSNQQKIQQVKQSVENLEQLFSYFEQTLTPDVSFKRIDISGSKLSIEGQGAGYMPVVDFYRKAEVLPLINDAQLGKVAVSATDTSLFLFSLSADLAGVLP